jgi:hypothetical protein
MSSNNSSNKSKLKEKLTKKYGMWLSARDINTYANMNKSSNEILNGAYNQSYRVYQLYLTKELIPSILTNLKSSPACPTELGKKGNSIRLLDIPGILTSILASVKSKILNEETLRRRLKQQLLRRVTNEKDKKNIINTLNKANMKGLRKQMTAHNFTKNNLKNSLRE